METLSLTRTILFRCSPPARKTDSHLCEHDPHVFMGCLLAAAGQVGDKSCLLQPSLSPILNCVTWPVL